MDPGDSFPAMTDETATQDALKRVGINKVEVLNNRLVPGSDGSIEHVVVSNDAVTVIRSTPLKGRLRVTRDNVYVGGVSCKIILNGLEARMNTVRHLVGGSLKVNGALFLTKQRATPVKHFESTVIGSPKTVVQHLIQQHCEAPPAADLDALARELDGMFLPYDRLEGNSPAA